VGTDGTYQGAQSTFLESDNSQSMTAISPTLRTTGVGLGEFPVTSPEALLQGGSFFERKWTRARSFTARHVRPPPHTGTRNKESSNYGGMCEPCIYVSFTQPSGAQRSHCEPLARNPETAYVQLQKHAAVCWTRPCPSRLWVSYTHPERHSPRCLNGSRSRNTKAVVETVI
jgi:hypothetical protein